MHKEDMIHTHAHTYTHTHTQEYDSAMKKNEVMPFSARWMGRKIILLSDVNQTEKNKYYSYVESKK